MDIGLRRSLTPSRDSAVFAAAGCLCTVGWWLYVFGVTSRVPRQDAYQFDGLSLLPGLSASLALLLLNVLSTRRQLFTEDWNMFAEGSSRLAKFLIFVYVTLNLGAVGTAIVLALVRYQAVGWHEAAAGLILQAVAIVAASFLIFFGRVLHDPSMFE